MDFWRFGAMDDYLMDPLRGSYDPFLVALSILVASLGALSALAVVNRVLKTPDSKMRLIWYASGAGAMGLGVWAMHFTGMLAFSLPVPTNYHLMTTAISGIPAVGGGLAALLVMSRPKVEWWRLQLGGLCMAVGIGAMHYVGMEGVRGDFVMRYIPSLFVLSIVVAHLLATLALYVRFFGAGSSTPGIPRRLISALAMGCAVSGMHYTAMRAVRFYARETQEVAVLFLPPGVMALVIFVIVALFLALAFLGAVFDQRLSEAHQTSKDSAARHRAALETMADGLVAVDSEGAVTTANPAADRMFGVEDGQLLGASIKDLLRSVTPRSSSSAQDDEWLGLLDGCGEEGCVIEGIRRDGTTFAADVRTGRMTIGEATLYSVVLRDISERRIAEEERRRLATAVQQVGDGILLADPAGRIEYVNPSFEALSGYTKEELIGTFAGVVDPEINAESEVEEIWATLGPDQSWNGSFTASHKEGHPYEVEVSISCITDDAGKITNLVAVQRDVTEQRALERQLGQSQKLESIGQLAAGIAHEINTPTQYVGDNTRFLEDAFSDLKGLFGTLGAAAADDKVPVLSQESWEEIRKSFAAADVPYLVDEIPKAIQQSLEGIDRVSTIVRAMKEFSHPSVEKTAIDLNAAISSTITVASNEWKYLAECDQNLDPELPHVVCVPGEFNQVILNMIVNAAHAISDVVGDGGEKGLISISTRHVEGWAEIVLADSGSGMPEHVREKVFDPFFTTKDVGRGTGQGLSIAHSVIVQKHGGTIDVSSEPGEGTQFTIRLPISGSTPVPPGQSAEQQAVSV